VVEVTSHRRPIARITGLKQPDPQTTNPLQNAIGAGIVRWSGQKPKPMLPPPVKLRGEGKLISDIVIEDRR
jgi:antitoxin (DNA-binding transcriptional repressor) of toxin-antitoxin stability system